MAAATCWEKHLDRVAGSAEYFDVPIRSADMRAALDRVVSAADQDQRVRLLVAIDDRVRTEATPFVTAIGPARVEEP
jgi:branched-subunit amino acid aminotransferase/4-amino-4-deoxychorismate lyase